MSGQLHESYAGDEVKLPPERSTGLVFAVVALIVAWFGRGHAAMLWSALGAAALLAALAFLKPAVLRPLNIVWFKFGMLLHRVVNPLVMFLIFTAVFIPLGFVMRLRQDPLRRSRTSESSYWIDRKDAARPGSMTNQF
jgi:hypothetical protein